MAKFIDSDGWLYIWGKLKTLFAGKVDKETGKGLSTNDYTTEEKTKLAGIAAGANAYTHPSYTVRTGKPTANQTPAFGGTATVSQVTSDASGHVTGMTDRTIKIPDTAMGAASSSAAGTKGLVPAPAAGDQGKFLTGAGTWETPAGTYSLPTASASVKGGVKVGAGLTMTGEVLSANVQSVPVMVGATSSSDGVAGLVPAPESGDRSCFLRGDGVWWETPDTDEKVKVTTLSSSGDTNYPLMAVNNTSPSSGHTYGAAIPTPTANRPMINGKTGVLTAASFSGSGAGLTNIPLSAIPNLSSTYALKSELPAGAFIYKGTVANLAALQAISSPSVGDVYNVGSDEGGMNYAWNGTSWDSLGEVMEVAALTNAEIDAIMAQ